MPTTIEWLRCVEVCGGPFVESERGTESLGGSEFARWVTGATVSTGGEK
jgi:hypothetical protein